MKTFFPLMILSVLCLGLSAGNPTGHATYVPYHITVNHPFNLNQLVAAQNKAHSNQRSVEWKEIAQREDLYDDTTSAWKFDDSILLGYNIYGGVDTEVQLTYTNGNWQNDIEFFEDLNSAGEVLYAIELEWNNGSSAWVNYENVSQTLDANGNILQSTYQYWVNNAWQNSTQSISTFDGHNNELTSISQKWNTNTNAWVNTGKEIYTWDGNNAALTDLEQSWDTVQAAWQNTYQYLYTNNTSGKHTVNVEQEWKYGNWENNSQTLSTYDGAGNDTLKVVQEWDSAGVQWTNDYKYTYAYDANNNNTYEEYYGWDDINTVWVAYTQYTYTYVNGNLHSTDLEQDWDNTNHVWTNYFKYQYTYDAAFNELTYTNYYWNSGSSNWQGYENYTYTYDANNNRITEVDQEFNSNNLTFENNARYFFYYSQLNVSGIDEVVNQINVGLYPNPSTGKNIELHADMEQAGNVRVGLYNADGKLVTTAMHQFTAGSNTLPLNYNIAAGNYYIQVLDYTTGKSSVLKLVRQ